MNTDYLRAVTSLGDEWHLSAVYLPSVMRRTLRLLIRLVGDLRSSMSLLSDTDCDAVDRWRTQLGYPPGFACLGFSAWLANNDTDDKTVVLSGPPLNISRVTAIYAALTDCQDLFANLSCLYSDVNSTSFSRRPVSDFMRTLLETRSGNFSFDNVTRRQVIPAELCPTAVDHSCFTARSAAAYVRVLSAYVTVHLAAYVFYRAVSVPGNDLIVSRSQSRLALGDGQYGSGILEHYADAASASSYSPLVVTYNCYDAILAVSNGHWHCK